MRFESLDALRGFAALLVLVFHFLTVLYHPLPAAWSPFRFFLAGHQAVIMFFVLSGFALTCMIDGMEPYSLSRYIAARVIRLYPPYILSIVFSLAVFGVLAAFGAQWQAGQMDLLKPVLTTSLAIGHLFMVGVFGMGDINPNIWSLVYEMRLSIAFPIILLAVSRFGIRAVCAFALLSVMYWARYRGVDWKWPATAIANLLETFHYATFFAMGVWLARNRDHIRKWIRALAAPALAVIWVAALAMFTYSFNGAMNVGYRALLDLPAGIASCTIVALFLDLPSTMISRFGKWLGKISYSLYLTHIPILHGAVILFYHSAGPALTGLAALVVSFAFASTYHRWIELPTIRLARRVLKNHPPLRSESIGSAS